LCEIEIPKSLTGLYGASARPSRAGRSSAFAPLRPPTRQQDPKQPIPTTQAQATSSAALEHGDLMVQRDHFQHQRAADPELPCGDRECSFLGIANKAGYLWAIETLQ
jgi:hypothetical protein